jgi:hypothetical protein
MSIKTVKAKINGTTYDLTYDSASGTYKASITAPTASSYNNNAGHYYPVTVTAEDTAGNSVSVDDTDATLGSSLQLRVKEKVAPTIAVTYPTAGARIINSLPTIQWTVKDDGSGVDTSTLAITINGTKITSGITATAITGGYSCSYTPSSALPEGTNTVAFDAKDNDENAATQVSASFIVDTVAPTLSLTGPTDNSVTNNKSCTVSGVTSDATSSPVTVTIKLNNVDQGSVTVDSSTGNFSKVVTLASGANTIVVTATDAAGKSTSITRTVTLDTKAPVISGVTITPNPADSGATLIITVTVSDE